MAEKRRTSRYLAALSLDATVAETDLPLHYSFGAKWVLLSQDARLSATAWRCLAFAMARAVSTGYWYVPNATTLAEQIKGSGSETRRALIQLEACDAMVQVERSGHWRKYLLNPEMVHRNAGSSRYTKRKEYARYRHERFGPVAEMWRPQAEEVSK